GSRPERPVDKLREAITTLRRSVGEVFSDKLPAIIISRRYIGIGAFKERDISFVPVPIAVVPKCLGVEKLLFVKNLSECRGGEDEGSNECRNEPQTHVRNRKHK